MTPSAESGARAADEPIAGNFYAKYETGNPLARILVGGFMRSFDRLVRRSGAREAHEIGCGEGHLTRHLTRLGLEARGSDLSRRVIDEARDESARAGLEIAFRVASLYDLERQTDGAELVVCCEVFEHVDDPERALGIVRELASPYLLLSVPREPLWRTLNMCRGRYLGDWGNTPGHIQHWSKPAFVRFLSQQVEIVAIESPLPWTMALCRV